MQHLYQFRDNDKHNCEGIIKVIHNQTKRPLDIIVFINTLLFDALIGNHDRHGRNLAFIVSSKAIALSPIYDNVSYLGLESGKILKADFNPFGKIATSSSINPGMKDYVTELIRLGYTGQIQLFFSKVKSKIGKIDKLITESSCSNLMQEAIKKLIHKRYHELTIAITNSHGDI